MSRRNLAFLLIILIPVFILVFPGSALAEDNAVQISNNTITIEAPEQTITGQAITLIAQVREKEYNEPVAGVPVDFFIKTEFFVNDLVGIGEAITDKQGIARIEYIPNQPGDMQIVASYKAGDNVKPIVAESMIIVSGPTKQFYQTMIGIEFPNIIFVWMASIVLAICVVWGTFMFVIYKVIIVKISQQGTGAKGASIALMIIVSILFVIVVFVLVTMEPQYNFGILP